MGGNNPSVTFDHSIMGVRIYDASVGRFISEDPIGLKADINLFRYVGNRPINRIDSTGLYEEDVEKAFGCIRDHANDIVSNGTEFFTSYSPESIPHTIGYWLWFNPGTIYINKFFFVNCLNDAQYTQLLGNLIHEYIHKAGNPDHLKHGTYEQYPPIGWGPPNDPSILNMMDVVNQCKSQRDNKCLQCK